MEIVIRQDPADVARTVAGIIGDLVTKREGRAGRPPVLGLATGSSPVATYQELIRRHRAGDLSFAGVTVFMLDEYVGLRKTHRQSYATFIREHFADHVDISDNAVHSPDGETKDIEAEVAAYERMIREAGGIDLQLLGVGTNGHIGFNEPGSSLSSRTRMKTLTARTRTDNARFFPSLDEVPRYCLTQGIGTIMESRHAVLTATGERKADAVSGLVEGPITAMCPGSVLQLHRHATIVIDEAAAGRLANREYYDEVLAHKPAWQSF